MDEAEHRLDGAPAYRSQQRQREGGSVPGKCPVTSPSPVADADGFDYRDEALAVALWPDGELLAGRLPDGSSYAELRPGGTIRAKLGWNRLIDGRLHIEGRRIDGPSQPLHASVPAGYGTHGFQPTVLLLPSAGCWRLAGSIEHSILEFVVRVRKKRASSTNG